MSDVIKLKVVIVGDSQVGKTNLLTRYVSNTFSLTTMSTFGHEYAKKRVQHDNLDVDLAIWDTAGYYDNFSLFRQERFRSIAGPYFREAKGALVVFDVTSKESFENTTRWIKDILDVEAMIPIILVGNKIDLVDQRVVSTAQGEDFARKNKIRFAETSAADGVNVNETFEALTELMMGKNRQVEKKWVEEENRVFIAKVDGKPQSTQSGCSC